MASKKKKLTHDEAIEAYKSVLKKNPHIYPPKKDSTITNPENTSGNSKGPPIKKKSNTGVKTKTKNVKPNTPRVGKNTKKAITKAAANKLIKKKVDSVLQQRDHKGITLTELTQIAKAKYLFSIGVMTNDELDQILAAFKPQ